MSGMTGRWKLGSGDRSEGSPGQSGRRSGVAGEWQALARGQGVRICIYVGCSHERSRASLAVRISAKHA
eukprot:11021572-Alexandrium_andersonii.AAC.1